MVLMVLVILLNVKEYVNDYIHELLYTQVIEQISLIKFVVLINRFVGTKLWLVEGLMVDGPTLMSTN